MKEKKPKHIIDKKTSFVNVNDFNIVHCVKEVVQNTSDCVLVVSRIRCHTAQIRSYRTSVKQPQLRLGAVITIEEFPKSGSGLFLKNSSRHYFEHCAVTRRLEKVVKNDIEYGIPALRSPCVGIC